MGVLLHGRAAARRVHHHHVHARVLELGDRLPGEPGGLGRPAAVQRQGTAAALMAGDDDVAALGREDPHGGLVDAGEEHLLHAAGEQADHRPARPLRGHPAGQRVVPPGRRRGHPQRGDQLRGEAGGQRAALKPPDHPGALRGAQRAGQQPEPPRVRERREDHRARRPGAPRAGRQRGRGAAGRCLPGPAARRPDEPVVLHPGRAGLARRPCSRDSGPGGWRRPRRPRSRRARSRPPRPRPGSGSSGGSARGVSPSPRPTAGM